MLKLMPVLACFLILTACSNPADGGRQETTITLSGKINVEVGERSISRIEIRAIDQRMGTELGRTSLIEPALGDGWSITRPSFASSTNVEFYIYGYDDKSQPQLFYKVFDGLAEDVTNQDVGGIDLSVPSLITLSGTINVAFNELPIHRVDIFAYVQSTGKSLGYTSLTQPDSVASWAITMPSFPDTDPTNIKFVVLGYDEQSQPQLFSAEFKDRVQGVTNMDVGEISFDIQLITLSGTIVTLGGQQISAVYIAAHNQSGDLSYGLTILHQPASGAGWSIAVPSFASPTDIKFVVDVYNNNLSQSKLFSKEFLVKDISSQDKTGITLNLEDIIP